jgi:hypothetical protein
VARSNSVTLTVRNPPGPQQYDAAGAAQVSVDIESPFTIGARPKVRRLTDADLRSRFPDDDGLKFADALATKPSTFMTAGQMRRQAKA